MIDRKNNRLIIFQVLLLVFLSVVVAAKDFKPFTFAVMTDPHLRYNVKLKSGKMMTGLETYLMGAHKIGQLKGKDRPDFVMITGDVGFRKMPEAMRKMNFMMPVPLHVVAGNTDFRRYLLRKWFPKDFQINGEPSDYYSFVHKGVRMIAICDCTTQEHIGQLSAPDIIPRGQRKWLEKELAKPEKRKIIFGHIPPHPESKDDKMSLSRNDNVFFTKLVEKYQPIAMFFGHQHRDKFFKVGGVPCYLIRALAPNPYGINVGFLLVKVNPKGVKTKLIEIDPDNPPKGYKKPSGLEK